MSLWHIKEDLNSLFSRSNDHFQPIDGLRSITCLMLMTGHLISILNALVPAYPHDDWLHYLRSFPFSVMPLLTLSLETFFVISGFLLTNKFIHQWDRLKKQNDFFTQYPTNLFRRACRYWPGILLISLIMFLLGEPNGNFASMWLFFQNYINTDNWSLSMSPLWSVSLDMQIHIILPVLLYFIYSYRKPMFAYFSLYVLVILSIIYIFFVFNPKTMDIGVISFRYSGMALLLSERVGQWIKSTYNVTYPIAPLDPNPMKLFMNQLYLPLLSRYSSFLIGSIVALRINDKKTVGFTRFNTIKKYIYFSLMWVYMLMLIAPKPQPPPNYEPSPSDHLIPTIFLSCSRQLFAISQAFLLFAVLCPSSHPYHSSWMKTILSFRIWSPIAKLSYLVYVIHYRIAFELITRAKLCNINRYSVGYSTLLHLPVVFITCLFISGVWNILVERPFERYIDRVLKRRSMTNKLAYPKELLTFDSFKHFFSFIRFF
jgi:peptidoglycan/LPS O-acetylase OafA/YrhL